MATGTLARSVGTGLRRTIRLPSEIITRVSRSFSGTVPRIGGVASGTVNPQRRTSALAVGLSEWDERDRLLSGAAYLPGSSGGNLKDVLRALGRDCTQTAESNTRVPPAWNGFRAIVDCYQNTLLGHFGQELKPVRHVDNGESEAPVTPALADALGRVMRWSQFDTEKDQFIEVAANQGTAGVRVVYDDGPPQRVYLDFDHPRRIRYVEEDARGNVVFVALAYDLPRYDADGNPAGTVAVREEFGKEELFVSVGGEEFVADNGLGVCPYVLLRHRRQDGTAFGRHAYAGSELAILHNNWLRAELGDSVYNDIWPTLFITSPAARPKKLGWSKYTFLYSRTGPNLPQPTADYINREVNVAGSLELLRENIEALWQSQPELIWSAIKLLSNISGETLARVQQPTEQAVLRARALYEDAFVRASQIAMSVGIFASVPGFDLGTGTGTREAADRAYDDGQGPEAWHFARRPALPPTAFQLQEQAKAAESERQARLTTARMAMQAGADEQEALRLAGYTAAEAAAIAERKRRQDVVPTEEQ